MHVIMYIHITFVYMTFAGAFMSMDIHVLTSLIDIILGLIGFSAYSEIVPFPLYDCATTPKQTHS